MTHLLRGPGRVWLLPHPLHCAGQRPGEEGGRVQELSLPPSLPPAVTGLPLLSLCPPPPIHCSELGPVWSAALSWAISAAGPLLS